MPIWLAIILVVLVALAVGGAVARRRQLARGEDRFNASLAQVNQELAVAHAEDRGWERDGLEAAARTAWDAQRPGVDPGGLTLVQIIDRPGTDDDKAVFATGAGQRLTLGRRDGAWAYESLDPA